MFIFKLLFGFSGRVNRLYYSLASTIVGIVGLAGPISWLIELSRANSAESAGTISIAVGTVCMYSQAALLTKRIRDAGRGESLLWVYYASVAVSWPLWVGAVQSIALTVIAGMLSTVSAFIILYAMFARSAKHDDPRLHIQESPVETASRNDRADDIIARALEERKRASINPPANNDTGSLRARNQPQPAGFGRRQNPVMARAK